MDCKEMKQKWERYLDGELEKSEQNEIQEHMRCCSLCEKELGGLATFLQRLYHVPEPVPPALAIIPKANVFRKYRVIQWALAAGVMIAAIVAWHWFMQSMPTIPAELVKKEASTKEEIMCSQVKADTNSLFLQIIRIQEHTIWQRVVPNGYITSEYIYSRQ